MNDPKERHKLSKDNKGALEGLPLYLIILVVIAAMAIVIIFSYLSLLKTVELDRLEVYIDGKENTITAPGDHEVNIIAIGNDGNKLEGVTITLSSNDINKAKVTDSSGKADFGVITFTEDGTPYNIFIEGSYSGGNIDISKESTITVDD
jgi:hypothetical protein